MNDEKEYRIPSSSTIEKPVRPNSGAILSESDEVEIEAAQADKSDHPGIHSLRTQPAIRWRAFTTQCYASEFWIRWMMFRTRIYEAIVGAIAGFIADIVTHPKLWDSLVNMVVVAINSFMDQEDIGTKFDKTARNVIYDPIKARETSKALGKEVVPMVTGFASGIASSLKPSSIRSRKKKRSESKKIRDSMDRTAISDITLSERLNHQEQLSDEDSGDECEGSDNNDHGNNHKNWIPNPKKKK